MKSFTSLEQSKKLAEILPIESADMSWVGNGLGKPFARTIPIKGDPEELCACWSLTALLDVLPTGKVLLHDKGNHGYKCICNYIDSYYFNNPVDACVEMILKLHELKML